MAEINLDFAVSTNNLTITPASTELAFTPNSTQLNIYTGYTTFAPGSSGQVLINTGGIVNAAATMTYNSGTNTVSMQNLVVTNNSDFGSVSNVTITGGTNGQFLKTDGAGNLSFATLSPAGSNTQLQYNNSGNFGAVPFLTFNGTDLSLGGVDHVKMTGGTNGYVLQTDGLGNLTWTAQTGGGGGNGSPGGANTQVQFNNAGLFGGDPGFTYNSITNTLNAGNIVSSSFNYPNGSPVTTSPAGTNTEVQFNDVGSFGSDGNLTFNKVTGALSALSFSGSGATLSSLSAGNLTGNLTNANVTGNIIAGGFANITGNLNVTGITSITPAKEKVTLSTVAPTGIINYDLLTQAVVLTTSTYPAVNNFVLNVRGNSSVALDSMMTTGQSMTCTYIFYNTYPAYYVTGLTIDGFSRTVSWGGGAPTTGVANSYAAYNFNIIKIGSNQYSVFGTTGSYT